MQRLQNSYYHSQSLRNVTREQSCFRTFAFDVQSFPRGFSFHHLPYRIIRRQSPHRKHINVRAGIVATAGLVFEDFIVVLHQLPPWILVQKLNELGIEPISELVEKVGGWPVVEKDSWNGENFNLWDQSIKIYQMGFSSDYIFAVSVDTDAKNNSHRVLHFDQPDLGLSKEYWDKGMENHQQYSQNPSRLIWYFDIYIPLGIK